MVILKRLIQRFQLSKVIYEEDVLDVKINVIKQWSYSLKNSLFTITSQAFSDIKCFNMPLSLLVLCKHLLIVSSTDLFLTLFSCFNLQLQPLPSKTGL